MAQIKIHKGGCYAHAQVYNAYMTSVWVEFQLNL